MLGLHFCARAFSSCGERGPLFIAVRGPLSVAACLVVEHRPQTRRLSSCGSRAQLPRGMWDLPRPGLKPVSPALAGRLSTTAPPGKPYHSLLDHATHGTDLMIQGRALRQCVDVYSNPFLLRALGTWWVPAKFCITMLELHSATAKRMPCQVMTSSLGFSRQPERQR